jgi:hypothetical protein
MGALIVDIAIYLAIVLLAMSLVSYCRSARMQFKNRPGT